MFFEIQCDPEWEEIHKAKNNREDESFHLRQLQLIYRQTCLIKGISEDIKLKTKESQRTVPTQSSLEDQPNNILLFSDRSLKMARSNKNIRQNQPGWMKLKYDETELRQALAQVKQHCSELTFQILQKISTFRINESPHFRKFIEKEIKSNQQLHGKWLKAYEQNLKMKKQMERKESIISKMQEQKLKLKKYEQNIVEKEKNFIKLQSVLINRERIDKETRKCLERQQQIITQERENLKQLKYQINLLLEQGQMIEECVGNCWKKDLFASCKNSLVKQRKLLQDQQELVKKHYQNTNFFVDQIVHSLHLKTITKS